MRQSFLGGFDDMVPFALVNVELMEQPDLRIIGRLLDGPDVPIQVGAAVKVGFEDVSTEFAVPAFMLEANG